MKSFLLGAALLWSVTSMANGRASLEIHGANAGYDVKQVENVVTGSIWNLGNSLHGKVELTKAGDLWTGRMGMTQVTVREVKVDAKGTHIYLSTLPGGFHSYTLKLNRKGNYVVSGLNANQQMVSGEIEKEGKHFMVSNNRVSVSLQRDEEGVLSGWTQVRRPWDSLPESFSTDLANEAELRGQVLAKEDPVLFVLLYVLPFNLNR